MKKVALTFDDGPNGKYTLKALEVLKEHDIRACFFLLGKNVERDPQTALRVKEAGHVIGNHSYNHPHFKDISLTQALQQIERTEEIFRQFLDIKPEYIRAPYGEYSVELEKTLKEKGYTLVGWDCCAEDWKNPSPTLIVTRITLKAKDNSIILLHDGASIRMGESRIRTVQALPDIIKTLKANDFKIVGLDEIFKR
jgi:peptidoglycan/xylan/chitin deacetylase (PgdA/CDA1 family)